RGDANLATYVYRGRPPTPEVVHRFRLALADVEALDRTTTYLSLAGIDVPRFRFAARTERRREMTAIRTQQRRDVEAIRILIAWPNRPSTSWHRGFLAGIYDAEG